MLDYFKGARDTYRSMQDAFESVLDAFGGALDIFEKYRKAPNASVAETDHWSIKYGRVGGFRIGNVFGFGIFGVALESICKLLESELSQVFDPLDKIPFLLS